MSAAASFSHVRNLSSAILIDVSMANLFELTIKWLSCASTIILEPKIGNSKEKYMPVAPEQTIDAIMAYAKDAPRRKYRCGPRRYANVSAGMRVNFLSLSCLTRCSGSNGQRLPQEISSISVTRDGHREPFGEILPK